jgi:hypothetical protein
MQAGIEHPSADGQRAHHGGQPGLVLAEYRIALQGRARGLQAGEPTSERQRPRDRSVTIPSHD